MTRALRRRHLGLWLVLAPLVLAALWVALAARPPLPIQASADAPAGQPAESRP
ncbi:MAG: hypothetical protein U1D55_05440 [Phycisphaerae bacterium]